MEEDKLLIGYYRLSMEDDSTQRESNSITNQRLLIKDYIQSDTELSGMKFQELYDDGKIEICWKGDNLVAIT